MYTDARNDPPVHFRLLQRGDSDLGCLGVRAMEQGQPLRATALAQRDGAGIFNPHFRKLVDATL